MTAAASSAPLAERSTEELLALAKGPNACDGAAWDLLEARGQRPPFPRPPGPSMRGSTMCQSGSIASGGTSAYCTCDWCY